MLLSSLWPSKGVETTGSISSKVPPPTGGSGLALAVTSCHVKLSKLSTQTSFRYRPPAIDQSQSQWSCDALLLCEPLFLQNVSKELGESCILVWSWFENQTVNWVVQLWHGSLACRQAGKAGIATADQHARQGSVAHRRGHMGCS